MKFLGLTAVLLMSFNALALYLPGITQAVEVAKIHELNQYGEEEQTGIHTLSLNKVEGWSYPSSFTFETKASAECQYGCPEPESIQFTIPENGITSDRCGKVIYTAVERMEYDTGRVPKILRVVDQNGARCETDRGPAWTVQLYFGGTYEDSKTLRRFLGNPERMMVIQ